MYTIRPLVPSDIPTVVVLHQKLLPQTMSSCIGKEYLTLLYLGLLRRKEHLCLCAEEKNTLVGVITATPDLAKTSSLLLGYLYPKALPYLLRSLMRRDVSLGDIVAQIRFEKALLARFPSPYATVLTVFVDTSRQGNGIGNRLVREVKKKMGAKKITTLYVDTLQSNTQAQHFYHAIGGTLVASIYEGYVYSLLGSGK